MDATVLATRITGAIGLLAGCGGSAAQPVCWAPFEPVAAGAGVPGAPADPELLKCRPGNAEDASEREVVVGAVRVQLLSPTLVRLEERGAGGFEDRCTFVVVDRDWPGAAHEVSRTAEGTVIDATSYRVLVPGEGASISGTKVLGPDGGVLHAAGGEPPPRSFLPGPGQPVRAWVMGDMPRIVPPSWGATPPPSPRADSGWDTDNDAADVYVFVPGRGGYRQLRRALLELTGPTELPPLYTFGLWMSRYFPYTEQSALDTIDGFWQRGIPLDLLVVDTDWRLGGSAGYEADPQYFPDMERFLASAHDRNVRVMLNDHPEPLGEALDPDELQLRYEGLTGLLAQGVDVWWYDRNWFTSLAEPVPGISKEVWGMRLYHDVTERFRPERRPLIMSNVEGIDHGIQRQPSSPAAHRFPIWWTGDTSDDGFRLWIDDRLVLDRWIDQAATEWTAAVDMEQGRTCSLRLEFYENGGNAVCQLRWQPPGHAPEDARALWLPPGVWHDAWTGATTTGPARIDVTSPLWQTPLFLRDGGIVATIPPIEHTGAAVWPRVVLDVFVPSDPTPARTERVLYEDDGVSPSYRLGEYGRTPLVLERGGCGRLVLGPTVGTFPGLPSARTWAVRFHLPAGTAPDAVTVGGDKVPVAPGPAPAGSAALLAPAAGDRMPLGGEGTAPGLQAGPVLELVVPDRDVRDAVEIRL